MEKISIATELNKAFEKDYAFLLDENWSEGGYMPEAWKGSLKLNTFEAAKILFQIEASNFNDLSSPLASIYFILYSLPELIILFSRKYIF